MSQQPLEPAKLLPKLPDLDINAPQATQGRLLPADIQEQSTQLGDFAGKVFGLESYVPIQDTLGLPPETDEHKAELAAALERVQAAKRELEQARLAEEFLRLRGARPAQEEGPEGEEEEEARA